MTTAEVSSITVDKQRRTTIPRDVLDAAGIPAGSSLVARAESPGRIVLESPQLLLKELQEWIAEGAAALAATEDAGDASGSRRPSMADELLAERGAEAADETPDSDMPTDGAPA